MVAHRRIDPDGGLLREIIDVRRRVQHVETRPSGVISTREKFMVTDPETGVQTIMGTLPDGSTGFQPFVGDIVPPPVATAPTASAQPGTITVTWDGTFVGGAEKPTDFEHLNVIGHKIVTGTTVLSLEVGSIQLANESVIITTDIISYGEQWEFSFESEDYNGNISVRSARTPTIDVISYVDDSSVGDALAAIEADVVAAQDAADTAQAAAGTAQTAANLAKAVADSAVSAGVNLVTNGGFETDSVWPVSSAQLYDTSQKRSGTRSFKLIPTSGNVWPLSGWVDGATGRTYRIEYWIKKSGTDAPALSSIGAVVQAKSTTDVTTTSTVYGTPREAVDISTTAFTKVVIDYTIAAANTVQVHFAPWVRQSTNIYWVDDISVTDITDAKAALDAAAAAQLKADQAFNNAANAATAAGNAQTSADGKNKNWYQDNPPAGTGHAVGDTWFDTNADNAISRWDGDSWEPALIGNSAIMSNLDAGKISVGTLQAGRIGAKSIDVTKLTITSTDNLIVGGDFSNGAASWQQSANIVPLPTGGRGSMTALRFTGSVAALTSLNNPNRVTVEPDNRFRCSIFVKSSAALAADKVRLVLRCYTTATAYTDIVGISNSLLVVGAWTQVKGISPALPANTIAVEFYLQVTNNATGTTTDIDYVSVTRAFDGNLVVDGAIDGQTITGATVQTAASGARIVLDQNSLNAWNTAGDNYFNMSSATGVNISSRGQAGFDITSMNHCTNPSFEVDISGWTAAPGQTIVRDTTQAYVGTASIKATHTSTADRVVTRKQGAYISGDYTASVYVRHNAATAKNMRINFYWLDVNSVVLTTGGTFLGTIASVPANTWTRVAVTSSGGKPSNASYMRIDIVGVGFTSTETMWADAVLWENEYSTVNPYYDGTTPESGNLSYAWSGTAHLSATHERTARDIKIKTGGIDVLNPGTGLPKQAPGVGFILPTPTLQTAGLFSDGTTVSLIEGASDPQLTRIDVGNSRIDTWSYSETTIQSRSRIYIGSSIGNVDIWGNSGVQVNGREIGNVGTWIAFTTQAGVPAGALWGPGMPVADSSTTDTGLISWPSNDHMQFRDAGIYALNWAVRLTNGVGTSGTPSMISFEVPTATSTSTVYGKNQINYGENQGAVSCSNVKVTAGQQIRCYMLLMTAGGVANTVYGKLSITRIG